MSLDGTGTKFISAIQHAGGRPGGCLEITIAFQPNGNYPIGGEPVSQFLSLAAMGTNFKVPSGVKPDAVHVSGGPALWWYDRANGTLRLWTTVQQEASAAAYSTNNLTSTGGIGPGTVADVVYIARFLYPLFGDMSR